MVTESKIKKVSAIPNQTTCPSSPAAREAISVAIPSDQLRKKGAMMQKANVSHGKPKMDMMVRRRNVTQRSSFQAAV
ncbi:hypothetical protein [Absidia glauca]|uniref:Uncharacterized protein n=1 Tax=Absidia glauca TaxID=4829 RepID=A0A168R3B8_ABSGL|nr:hypothetical protein [Absidia glauca]